MPDFPISHNAARGLFLARAAEAMLRSLGSGEAIFRVPTPAAGSADPTRQELGLDATVAEDVAVSPVLLRAAADGLELVISPKSLEPHLQVRGQTADEFLAAAASIAVQGQTLRIQSFAAECFAGAVYLYRITAVTMD